jgi:RimJ/RimL family protein N-acetyltransferase
MTDETMVPTLETDRLRLRSLTNKDIDGLYAIFSDPQVMRYWSTPPLPNRAAAERLFQEILEGHRHFGWLKWGMVLKEDDSLIGTLTLFHLDRTHRRGEIGYALGRKWWGLGFMNEALHGLISYAFKELDLHRLEADVDPRNEASIKTLQRLGFKREGYLRERWHVGGEIQDAFFYGLLRREYEKLSN